MRRHAIFALCESLFLISLFFPPPIPPPPPPHFHVRCDEGCVQLHVVVADTFVSAFRNISILARSVS